MDQERDRRGGREDEKKKRNDADACERRDKARRAEIIQHSRTQNSQAGSRKATEGE